MDFQTIKPEITDYLTTLKENLSVDEVILYGSFAQGNAKKESDVDLIVISSEFNSMTEDERLKILYRNSVGFPYNLHAYGFTPLEWETVSPLTSAYIAKQTGQRID